MYQSFPIAPGQHVPLTEPRPAQIKVEKMLGTANPAGPVGRHIWPFLATYGDKHVQQSALPPTDLDRFIT